MVLINLLHSMNDGPIVLLFTASNYCDHRCRGQLKPFETCHKRTSSMHTTWNDQTNISVEWLCLSPGIAIHFSMRGRRANVMNQSIIFRIPSTRMTGVFEGAFWILAFAFAIQFVLIKNSNLHFGFNWIWMSRRRLANWTCLRHHSAPKWIIYGRLVSGHMYEPTWSMDVWM